MKKKGNNIGWCDITVNPVQGCPRGCVWNGSECYAKLTWNRHKGQPGWCKDFSKPEFFLHRLKGFRTKEPLIIFIDSMSDIGYWEDEWLYKTRMEMFKNPQNIYLALTKKYSAISRIKDWLPNEPKIVPPMPRIFIGATVTNNAQAQAVIDAGGADFISFEPLLERISPVWLEELACKWWIIGDLTKNGKSQGATEYEWVNEMTSFAMLYGVPVFMKESLRDVAGNAFFQQFPYGWKP